MSMAQYQFLGVKRARRVASPLCMVRMCSYPDLLHRDWSVYPDAISRGPHLTRPDGKDNDCFIDSNDNFVIISSGVRRKNKTKNWLEIAESDLGLAKKLIKDSSWRYYSPHFCHQSIEKLLKAIIVEKSEDLPPYIHKLKKLSEIAKIKLSSKQIEWILTLDPLYISTKYPEELNKIKKECDEKFVSNVYKNTQEIFKWLIQQLK
ncbi:MAG: HEPN protein [uncultured bacterium]|nr:MAG: HEPN protein [uncultured bacterium]